MLAAETTTVNHLRLRHAQVDAPVARLRLSRLLAQISLCPAVMPPSAVLLVRTMADPMPGAINRGFGPDARAVAAWERAAQSQLSTIYRRAARPVIEPVSSSSDAVLFADHAELLASLALPRDAVGSWWKSLLLRHFSLGSSESWLEAWEKHTLYVPAALHALHEQRRASDVVNRLTAAEAWRLLQLIADNFRIPQSAFAAISGSVNWSSKSEAEVSPQRSPDERTPPPPNFGLSSSSIEEVDRATSNQTPTTRSYKRRTRPTNEIGAIDAASSRTRDEERPNRSGTVVEAPWELYLQVGSIPNELGLAQRCLLGVSLLLYRAPHLVSSESFALRLSSWLVREAMQETPAAPIHTPSLNIQPRAETLQPLAIDEPLARASNSSICLSLDADLRPNSQCDKQPVSLSAADPTSQPVGKEPARMNHDLPGAPTIVETPSTLARLGRADNVRLTNSPLIEPDTQKQSRLRFENGCHTSAGGIFYLIHLLRRCNFFDFDIGLSGWALLELLTRCLLEETCVAISCDPIWNAFALLDGRQSDTSPGESFQPRELYEASESWLVDSGSATHYVRFRSNRLEVWHCEGFLTLDSEGQNTQHNSQISTLPRIPRQQQRALRRTARVHPWNLPLSSELRRFLHFLLPFARWRLDKALHGASLRELLLRNGTLYVTRTHIDLVMGMRQISVPARRAGFDANPGWVPELSRIITFHFVEDDPGGLRM